MTRLRPWYHLVKPRENLREGRPLDASEFAVHLDQVRDRLRAEIEEVFGAGKGAERIFFPEQTNQVPDRAVLTLVCSRPRERSRRNDRG